jgi:hypothetical protein
MGNFSPQKQTERSSIESHSPTHSHAWEFGKNVERFKLFWKQKTLIGMKRREPVMKGNSRTIEDHRGSYKCLMLWCA